MAISEGGFAGDAAPPLLKEIQEENRTCQLHQKHAAANGREVRKAAKEADVWERQAVRGMKTHIRGPPGPDNGATFLACARSWRGGSIRKKEEKGSHASRNWRMLHSREFTTESRLVLARI